MYGCKPRLPIDIRFGLTSPQSEEHFHKKFLAKLSTQLWWCYELPNQYQCKESSHQKWQYDQKMQASRLKPHNFCLVWQKASGEGKHKIGESLGKHDICGCWVTTNLYTIKPWLGVGRTRVVHQNILMHNVPPHGWDETQSESEDSEYDTPPGDAGLPKSTSSTTRPVIWSQTRACQLAQSIQDTWTIAVQYVQCK